MIEEELEPSEWKSRGDRLTRLTFLRDRGYWIEEGAIVVIILDGLIQQAEDLRKLWDPACTEGSFAARLEPPCWTGFMQRMGLPRLGAGRRMCGKPSFSE
jgi:hypothetical protein